MLKSMTGNMHNLVVMAIVPLGTSELIVSQAVFVVFVTRMTRL